MKNLIIVILISAFNVAFGQPSPQDDYPKRIEAITKQLKKDPLNYGLIWERLVMKVNLMGSFPTFDELFYFKIDSFKMKKKELYFDEFNQDFNKVYTNVIQLKHYDIVEEGDFYISRLWFYFNMLEFDKAIEDAIYLRDKASYSRYYDRGDYYNDWANTSLFNLYILKKDYPKALGAINDILKKQKNEKPGLYYSGTQNSYHYKIKLYEHFNEKKEIIPYLKQLIIENFQHYLEIVKYKNQNSNPDLSIQISNKEYYTSKSSFDYFLSQTKYMCFYFLKQLVGYMQKSNDEELPKYEKIYDRLRFKVNENFESINPDITDDELRSILTELMNDK